MTVNAPAQFLDQKSPMNKPTTQKEKASMALRGADRRSLGIIEIFCCELGTLLTSHGK
jgi:hypothetical protein